MGQINRKNHILFKGSTDNMEEDVKNNEGSTDNMEEDVKNNEENYSGLNNIWDLNEIKNNIS
jgi:hypothetical protein